MTTKTAIENLHALAEIPREEIVRKVLHFPEFVDSLEADKSQVHARLSQNPVLGKLHWAAIGVTKEAAEILEMIADHIFYGQEIDPVGLIDEIGDLQFHLQTICNALGYNRLAPLAACVAKNTIRYPEGVFREEHANRENRNREKERHAIELMVEGYKNENIPEAV